MSIYYDCDNLLGSVPCWGQKSFWEDMSHVNYLSGLNEITAKWKGCKFIMINWLTLNSKLACEYVTNILMLVMQETWHNGIKPQVKECYTFKRCLLFLRGLTFKQFLKACKKYVKIMHVCSVPGKVNNFCLVINWFFP